MLKRTLLHRWWSRCLLIIATYVIAADFLPNLLLVMVESIGYLPYSDRPGPGWHMLPHVPRGPEWEFFAGFSLLLLGPAAFCGFLFAVSGLILGFCSMPRWALRVFAAPTTFLASGLVMAGTGWLIAVSALGVYLAAGCGLFWGLFVFPRLVPQMNRSLSTPARIALPILMLLGGTYWLIKPMLPNPRLTNAKIEVLRHDDTGTDLSKIDLSFVGPPISQQAEGSGRYVSVSRIEFITDNRNQLRALLIVDDDRPVAHTFVLPRSGNAIYRQRQGRWYKERPASRNSEISLELTSDGAGGISLEIKGPCCSSMSQSLGPYR